MDFRSHKERWRESETVRVFNALICFLAIIVFVKPKDVFPSSCEWGAKACTCSPSSQLKDCVSCGDTKAHTDGAEYGSKPATPYGYQTNVPLVIPRQASLCGNTGPRYPLAGGSEVVGQKSNWVD